MNKISTIIATGLTGVILGTGLVGCGESLEQKSARIEREKVTAIAYEKQLESKLKEIEGLAFYSIPIIEIKSQRDSFTLDPFTHIGDTMKAQVIRFPVSEKYFNSVNVGDKLSSKFNLTGLIFNGEITSYSNTISDKTRKSLYCAVKNENCEEINPNQFQDLLTRGKEIFSNKNESPLIYIKGDSKIDLSRFTYSCNVGIETSKTNYTLDVLKHIENAFNEMNFELTIPKFICEQLTIGKKVDSNFVGASLFFSKSPSEVNYKVKSIKKNY